MTEETTWDGRLISSPGMYRDVRTDAYHSQLTITPSVSSSGLRAIWSKSPAHFYDDSYLNPNRPEQPERPHFSIGRAAHHLLLQGRKGFDDEFVVRPEQWADWRSKDARTWRETMIAQGKTVITLGELDQIAGMAGSLGRDPLVRAGILDGLVERTIVYRDPETGVFTKARPDAIPGDADFADLKSSAAVDDDSIQRSITDFGYHQQGALVRSAALHGLGVVMQDFTLVFVEKTRPFCVRVVPIPIEDLDRGEAQNRVALWKFARGIETGEWPGPGEEAGEAYRGLQPYARARIDARLAVEIPEIEAAKHEATR